MEIAANRRNVYFALAALAAVVLSAWLFWPSAVKVEMARVRRLPLTDSVDAEGYTRVKRKYTVTAPVSGKLKRIELREGDNILQNYLITEVDPNPPIPRAPAAPDRGFNPYAAKIYAPVGGTVLRIFEPSERFIDVGTPLIEIGNPADIEIVADVLSTDAGKIDPGALVLIENRQSGESTRARVKTVEPQAETKVSALGVEEKRVDIVADFVGSKPAFGDNYRIDVRIVVWQGDNVLCVPNAALFTVGTEWNVFVVRNGRAYRRTVATRHRSGSDTEIIDGLGEGDVVVLHPPNTLEDGTRVSEE